MNFRCKNLLITGGSGFIGSNFISHILAKYSNVNIYNLDCLTYAGNENNNLKISLNSRYKFIKGNICDRDLVFNIFDNYEIDGVINFAAESHVDNSISDPSKFIETNINGVYNLLNTAYSFWMDGPHSIKSKYKMARFHQISTDEVYGSIQEGSFNEKNKYYPNSPYSSSKASADLLVRSYNITYGLNTTISISSNNFGENQNIEKFIPKFIYSLINNKSFGLYGDGQNIRDWIYVLDNCEAIDVIYSKSKAGEVYNISAGNEYSNNEIIQIIYKIISEKIDVYFNVINVKDRPGHDKRYSVSSKKIYDDFKWKPKFKFVETIEKYIIKEIK